MTSLNSKVKTGRVEVEAESVEVLNTAKKNLPFEVRRYNRAGERLRLTHRYIDLRCVTPMISRFMFYI